MNTNAFLGAERGHSWPYAVSVAQSFTLLGRIEFCEPPASSSVLEGADGLPITNRRYSRLKVCAATNDGTLSDLRIRFSLPPRVLLRTGMSALRASVGRSST